MSNITIEKIAELAGVSRGTVDRVIHGRDGVKEEVRLKVNEILEETGYRKNKSDKKEAKRKSYKQIAVIMPKNMDSYFSNMRDGIDHELERYEELSLEYYYCNELHVDMMISILSYVSSQKADAIAIRGFNHPELCACLNKISGSGIPVVLFDSDIKGVNALCKIREDAAKSGRIAASLLAKSIDNRGDVAIIAGFDEIDIQHLRESGFREKADRDFPEISVCPTVYTYDQDVIAYDKTLQLLLENPELKGLFCLAGTLPSIMKAVLDSGRSGSLKIVCYNASSGIVEYIKDGTISFVLDINPYYQGEQVIRVLYQYLIHGQLPEEALINTPVLIGIDENIDYFR